MEGIKKNGAINTDIMEGREGKFEMGLKGKEKLCLK